MALEYSSLGTKLPGTVRRRGQGDVVRSSAALDRQLVAWADLDEVKAL